MTAPDWDENYKNEELPWDTGETDPVLTELVTDGTIAPGKALEVGCGTGTNAIYLASAGFEVVGVDLSPTAITLARAKPGADACTFEALDFFEGRPPGGPFDLVFDRGCFHTFDEPERRALFAARVADLLAPGGAWVSLVGSTEGPPRDHGPPRRSARDLAAAVEPVLAIDQLRTFVFRAHIPSPAQAWLMIARRREVPAQPSSRRDP